MAVIGSGTIPTVTPPSGGSIGIWTVEELSGNAQTNMPVEFGLPVKPGTLLPGMIVQVLDGMTPLVGQTDLQASDKAGSNVRFVKFTGILPTLGATASKQLTVNTLVSAPSSGTAITAADILALCSGAFEPCLTTVTFAGTPTDLSCRAALAGGGWAVGAAVNFGAVRSGPFCTEILCSLPLGNYLRVWFHVAAYKAGSGAVTAQGGGNPILAVRVDRVMENGYVQQNVSTPLDLFYGIQDRSSTSLTNAALTLANNVILADGVGGPTSWSEDTTSAGTITVGSLSDNTITTISRGTGTWTADDNGRILRAAGPFSTGAVGQICSVNVGSNTASLRVPPFRNFVSLTLAPGGDYTLEGVGHPYATRHRQRLVIGNPVATADSQTQIVLPWDGSGTRSVMPYLASTKMLPNYATLPANVPSQSGAAANAWGKRPYGMLTDGTSTSPANGIRDDFGSSGDGPGDQIGIIAGVDCLGSIACDVDGQFNLFRAAMARSCMQVHYRDTATGLGVALDSGTDWIWPGGSDPNQVAWDFGSVVFTSSPHGGLDTSHACAGAYLAYLLTGDWYWLEAVQSWAWYFGWAGTNPGGGTGSQLTRCPVGNGDATMRAQAWQMRSILQGAAVTPDATLPLGITKAKYDTWLANIFSSIKANIVDDHVNYGTNGPRWLHDISPYRYGLFEFAFYAWAMNHGKELGQLDSNGVAAKDWCAVGVVPPGAVDTADVAPDWFNIQNWPVPLVTPGSASPPTTWADAYQRAAALNIDPTSHQPTATTVTLSTLSGSAINATFSPWPFGADPSFYIGGLVQGGGGTAAIVSLNVGGSSGVLDATVTGIPQLGRGDVLYNGGPFASLTFTTQTIPYPSPVDSGPPNSFNQTREILYQIMTLAACSAMMQDDGVSGASTAVAYYQGQAAGMSPSGLPTTGTDGEYEMYVQPR